MDPASNRSSDTFCRSSPCDSRADPCIIESDPYNDTRDTLIPRVGSRTRKIKNALETALFAKESLSGKEIGWGNPKGEGKNPRNRLEGVVFLGRVVGRAKKGD